MGTKTGWQPVHNEDSDRIYRIDRINSSCESCYPVHIFMACLPEVIADLHHLNTSLKLHIEPGGIRLKMV